MTVPPPDRLASVPTTESVAGGTDPKDLSSPALMGGEHHPKG